MSEKDIFREKFKYFRNRNAPVEFGEVVDFDADLLNARKSKLCSNSNSCSSCSELGLRDHNSWDIHSLTGLDGFLFLKNPFTSKGQKLWIEKCVKIYPQKPSRTNLDLHQSTFSDSSSLCNNDSVVEKSRFQKLSWCTFGYHHNWDSKEYDPCHQSPFPKCLDKLSRHIASCVGFEQFVPEAAIINYYNMKSNLGIHNDHSEKNLTAPILSLSFGQTAIFLIGERTKKPTSLFIRSGDIILMFGPSRLAYHAVPRIISEDVRSRITDVEDDQVSTDDEYLSAMRINISVRQVY